MTDVILRGSWPDGDALATAPEISTQASPAPQATIWCATSGNGARVGIESDVPIKGVQVRLVADRLPTGITLLPGRDLPDDFVMEKMVIDGELRLLIYSPHGRSIPAGTSDLVEISGISGNWSFAAPAVLAGMENNSLSVRSELRGPVAGIDPDAATQPAVACSPNPLATAALIRYRLENAAVVTVTISDVKGREVARPLTGIRQDAGEHILDFDATDIPAGNYFCAIAHDGIRDGIRLVVVR
ncbi:MAG: T9SS type A sorting domain-containing protein, partial [Bacteroidota bacterium]